MFDEKYIQEKINIIFDVELDNLRRNESFDYVENPDEPNAFHMEWEPYDTLKRLYISIRKDPSAKKALVYELRNKLLDGYSVTIEKDGAFEFHDASFLAFYFLMKIGKASDAIESVKKRYIMSHLKFLKDTRKYYNKHRRHPKKGEVCQKDEKTGRAHHQMEGLFEDILMCIRFEPAYFEYNLLAILKQINLKINYSSDSTIQNDFAEVINAIQYRKLQDELLLENEGINTHQGEVIRILLKLGFPGEMEEYLSSLGSVSELPHWDKIGNDMVDTLWIFFDELVINVVRKIESKTKQTCPDNSQNMQIQNSLDYIKTNLEFSDLDVKLIDSFISILYTEGEHAFLSEKRYFIFTKNIGIEISYFLLSRLMEFLDNNTEEPTITRTIP